MNKKKNFFIKYKEQILNIAIIIATMFLILVWTACERKFYTSLSDKCIVLYNGRYDIVYIEDDSLYLFVPTMDNNNTIQIYKNGKTNNLEILENNEQQ